MKAVAGTVVLFHPDADELLRNIQTYLPFLDQLFVIDNTAIAGSGLKERIMQLPGPIQYIANLQNEGIAATLNKAATLASQAGYAWLLTMDQDSFFTRSNATGYFSHFSKLFCNNRQIAIVAPSIAGIEEDRSSNRDTYSEQVSVITSGSLLQLQLWKEVGGFEEKLFIDEVDHEYCYRAYLKGYKIIRFDHISLNHALGTKKEAGYLGALSNRMRTIHSPARVYFMVRNYLFIRNKYRKLLPQAFTSRDAALLTILKNNLFFSGAFISNLKSIFRAFNDYRKGNFSTKI